MSTCAGLIALSAYYGAIGMMSGLLAINDSMVQRLPLHSLVFAGIALALVVALPSTVVAALAWRGHPRARDAATLTGLLLVGWIVVEAAIVREFSPLQVVCGAAGIGLMLLGNVAVLRQVADVLIATPLFLTAPLWRRWHLRWGATATEAPAPMPGDELVPVSHLTATRAITIAAPPDQVWPWLLQVGYGRAGFYSYDLLDSLGRPSAREILPEWQHPHLGEVAAPMANPPTPQTSFRVARLEPPNVLVWVKPDSSWSWTLRELPGGRTRLVTRLRQRYRRTPFVVLSVLLMEFGDFPMMRKMLHGIKARAELPENATRQPLTAPTSIQAPVP